MRPRRFTLRLTPAVAHFGCYLRTHWVCPMPRFELSHGSPEQVFVLYGWREAGGCHITDYEEMGNVADEPALSFAVAGDVPAAKDGAEPFALLHTHPRDAEGNASSMPSAADLRGITLDGSDIRPIGCVAFPRGVSQVAFTWYDSQGVLNS